MAPTTTSMPAQLTTEMETHASRLIFDDRWVFKCKKPLDLGFADNRTLEARRHACEEEVRLNRRLASDVYRGVVDHRLPDGSVEPTVVMQRLPAERRLTACIAEGLDVREALDNIARQLVCLHQQSAPGPDHDELDSAAARLRRWNDAADRLRPLIAGTSLEMVAARADELAERYLRGREPLFRARIAAGRVRDGHGDLRAEDIFLLPHGPVILDCLEFDENLRWGDVLDDIAFLAMDLRALGRPELAVHLLDQYRELSGDRWPASLVEMAIAQRAHIRAMIDAVRANQRGDDPAAAAAAKLALCVEALQAAQVRMVLVGGAPGTGKTSLAGRIGEALEAVVISSDRVRTEVSDALDPDRRYEVGARHAVYEEMRRRAELLLAQGEHVVLDATWSDPDERAAARRIGGLGGATTDELWCIAPVCVAAERIRGRCAHGVGLSEVTPAQAIRMTEQFEDWPEADEIHTERPLEDSLRAALHHLGVEHRVPDDSDATI